MGLLDKAKALAGNALHKAQSSPVVDGALDKAKDLGEDVLDKAKDLGDDAIEAGHGALDKASAAIGGKDEEPPAGGAA